MRFNEAVCNSMSPVYIGLQNNNQLQRSSSEIVINDKTDPLIENQDTQEFRIGQNTSTYSSLAITRNNKILKHKINNNLENTYQSSSTESLTDYEGYYDEASQEQTGSDWSEYSDDGNFLPGCRGIVNPNYPGFQHLGRSLLSDTDDTEDEQEFAEELIQELGHQDKFNNNNNKNSNNNNNNNNNNIILNEEFNRFDAKLDDQKQLLYEKPKFNIQTVNSLIERVNFVKSIHESSNSGDNFNNEVEIVQLTTSVKESLQFPEIEQISDSSKNSESEEIEETILEKSIDLIREANALKQPDIHVQNPNIIISNSNININNNKNNNNNSNDDINMDTTFNVNKILGSSDSDQTLQFGQQYKLEGIDLLASIKNRGEIRHQEKQEQSSVPDVVAMELDVFHIQEQYHDANKFINGEFDDLFYVETKKKEKMIRNQARRRQQNITGQKMKQDIKCRSDAENGSFDVYNIETAMPNIDMDAIETHLKAAREEERRRRNDREEIRKRLAMGSDADDIRSERGRKPSLQSRLQSGMNLQICFMNETSSDTESVLSQDSSEAISPIPSPSFRSKSSPSSLSSAPIVISSSDKYQKNADRPQVLSLPPLRLDAAFTEGPIDEADFFARQTRLQIEARMALAQAKEMAHMQMEIERQRLKQNPITEMVRASLYKIGVMLGEDRRRLTRALLTELNIAQLQVLANDLHARIATLNESLVEGLLRRDDLHMEQDSMLVDVEDLTRYLGAKQESLKKHQQLIENNSSSTRFHVESKCHQELKEQQQTSRARTLSLLGRASSTRLAAGRQLVVNFVRK